MRNSMLLAAAGLAMGVGSHAFAADSGNRRLNGPERTTALPAAKTPYRIARVIGRDKNGMPIPGPWHAYRPNRADGQTLIELFDHYEGSTFCTVGMIPFPPTDGAVLGGFGDSCAGLTECDNVGFLQTGRWFLGATFRASGYIGKVETLAQGMNPTAFDLALDWFELGNSGTADPCGDTIDRLVIFISTYDETVGDLIDGVTPITLQNLEDGFVDGVLLDFGAQGAAQLPARFVSQVFLDPNLDPDLPIEMVEGGAWEISFVDATLVGNELQLNRFSANNQATLWHSKDAAGQGSSNGFLGIDGDGTATLCTNPDRLNGTYEADEVGEEDFGTPCPTLLTAAVGFYGEPGSTGPVCPDSFTRVRGLPIGGNLASLCTSDDNHLITRPDVFRTSAVPPVQIQLDFTSTDQNPPVLRLVVESAANVNNISQRVNLFNWDTQAYELIATNVLTQVDTTREYLISTNPGRFVQDGTGAVRALIQCNSLAFSIAPIWQYRIDLTQVSKNQ
ncbi:MAG: hypothetical protein HRU76_05380 [Phycisphaeraceae bacterium]|nr:MAG: hypothetical protein HRU76_05380 [Phycisphaeraceae bacterium]